MRHAWAETVNEANVAPRPRLQGVMGTNDTIAMQTGANGTVVAFADSTLGGRLSVARWDASTQDWDFFGSRGVTAGEVRYLSIALDASNLPVVAFKDFSCVGGVGRATVLRWDGTAWADVGSRCFSLSEAYEVQVSS